MNFIDGTLIYLILGFILAIVNVCIFLLIGEPLDKALDGIVFFMFLIGWPIVIAIELKFWGGQLLMRFRK